MAKIIFYPWPVCGPVPEFAAQEIAFQAFDCGKLDTIIYNSASDMMAEMHRQGVLRICHSNGREFLST